LWQKNAFAIIPPLGRDFSFGCEYIGILFSIHPPPFRSKVSAKGWKIPTPASVALNVHTSLLPSPRFPPLPKPGGGTLWACILGRTNPGGLSRAFGLKGPPPPKKKKKNHLQRFAKVPESGEPPPCFEPLLPGDYFSFFSLFTPAVSPPHPPTQNTPRDDQKLSVLFGPRPVLSPPGHRGSEGETNCQKKTPGAQILFRNQLCWAPKKNPLRRAIRQRKGGARPKGRMGFPGPRPFSRAASAKPGGAMSFIPCAPKAIYTLKKKKTFPTRSATPRPPKGAREPSRHLSPARSPLPPPPKMEEMKILGPFPNPSAGPNLAAGDFVGKKHRPPKVQNVFFTFFRPRTFPAEPAPLPQTVLSAGLSFQSPPSFTPFPTSPHTLLKPPPKRRRQRGFPRPRPTPPKTPPAGTPPKTLNLFFPGRETEVGGQPGKKKGTNPPDPSSPSRAPLPFTLSPSFLPLPASFPTSTPSTPLAPSSPPPFLLPITPHLLHTSPSPSNSSRPLRRRFFFFFWAASGPLARPPPQKAPHSRYFLCRTTGPGDQARPRPPGQVCFDHRLGT